MEHMSLQEDSGIGEDDSSCSLHPDRYDHEHISKLEDFSQDLQKAIASSFPRSKSLYTAVHVLLLRWAEDDLNVQFELTMLRNLFENHFKFATEQWDIPSLNPTRALQTKLYGFQDAHQDENELLIVYYGGHGYPDPRRGRSIWAAYRKPESPTLMWSSLQHLLEYAVPHVLIILDCCFAGSAARDTAEGTTKELLAACGREIPTAGVGSHSFTSALIEELHAFGQAPFTVAMLHSRLVTMRWRLAHTPIYALLSEHGGSSITIAPIHASSESTLPSTSNDSSANSDAMEVLSPENSMLSTPSQQSLSNTAADTRVLLAISIADDAVHDIAQWKSWLTSQTPWDVTKIEVKIEAVFESHSTMLITSVPIFAWDALPNKAAYQFIGFIKSENLQQPRSSSRLAAKKAKLGDAAPLATPPHSGGHVARPSVSKSLSVSPDLKDAALESTEIIRDTGSIPRKRGLPPTRVPSPRIQEFGTPSPGHHSEVAKSNITMPLPLSPSRRLTIREGDPVALLDKVPGSYDPVFFANVARHDTTTNWNDVQLTPTTKKQVDSTGHGSPTYPKRPAETDRTSLNTPRSASRPWSAEDDAKLVENRKLGMNWEPIGKQYFPSRTANACRKRHERLTEKRRETFEQGRSKSQAVADAYLLHRERMWQNIAKEFGEKWQVVEAKCMEQGLQNLTAIGRRGKESTSNILDNIFADSAYAEDLNDDFGLEEFHDNDSGFVEGSHPASSYTTGPYPNQQSIPSIAARLAFSNDTNSNTMTKK